MKARGLNAKEIAEIAGVVPSAVAKWKAGGKIGADKLQRIADHFGESVDWLLGRKTDELHNPHSKSHRSGLLGADCENAPGNVELNASYATAAPVPDAGREITLAGAGETVNLRGMMYGAVPPYYDVPYQPQWNVNLGRMTDDEIIANVRDGVERIKNKPRGPDRAHTCHYLMDFLNELANRKEKKGDHEKT